MCVSKLQWISFLKISIAVASLVFQWGYTGVSFLTLVSFQLTLWWISTVWRMTSNFFHFWCKIIEYVFVSFLLIMLVFDHFIHFLYLEAQNINYLLHFCYFCIFSSQRFLQNLIIGQSFLKLWKHFFVFACRNGVILFLIRTFFIWLFIFMVNFGRIFERTIEIFVAAISVWS